jgi:hypothetical protein
VLEAYVYLSVIPGKYPLPSLPLGCLLLDYGSLVPSPSLFLGVLCKPKPPGSCLSRPITSHVASPDSPPKILTCPVLCLFCPGPAADHSLTHSLTPLTLPVSCHCNSLSLQGPSPIALRISSIPSFPFRSLSLTHVHTLDLALCRTPIFSSSRPLFFVTSFVPFTGPFFSSASLHTLLCWVFHFPWTSFFAIPAS